MAISVILVGCGGWGRTWCKNTLPRARERGLVEIVGAVDFNSENLLNARELMGLPDELCFASLQEALQKVKADACILSVRPSSRLELAQTAFSFGCDILCEKPIADTMESAMEIYRLAEEKGCRVGVTMSHRFSKRMATFRREVKSGKYGPLQYLVCHFAGSESRGILSSSDNRIAQEENAIFTEAALHQVDYLRDLVGGECVSVYANAANAPLSGLKKYSLALVNMRFDSDVLVQYEFSYANAASLYSWSHDYIRAELRDATIVLTEDEVRIYPYEENIGSRTPSYHLAEEEKGSSWGNNLLLEKFVHWCEGSAEMETYLGDNIKSFALLHAIIRSCDEMREIKASEYLETFGL